MARYGVERGAQLTGLRGQKPSRLGREGSQVIIYGESERQLLEDAAREWAHQSTKSGAQKFEIYNRPRNIPGLDQALIGVLRTQRIADLPGAIQIFTESIAAQARQLANEVARQMAANGQKMAKQQIEDLTRDLAYEPSAMMVLLASDESARFRHDIDTPLYKLIQKLRFPDKKETRHIHLAGKIHPKLGEVELGKFYRLLLDVTIFPFSKIPAGAARARFWDYTPLGFYARSSQRLGAVKHYRQTGDVNLGGEEGTTVEQQVQDLVQRWRQGLLGSLAMIGMDVLGWWLWDRWTGGRDDRQKIGELQDALHENYDPELFVGDHAFKMSSFGVLGGQMSALARMAKAAQSRVNSETGEPERGSPLGRGVFELGRSTVGDLPLGRGIADKLDALSKLKTGDTSGAARGLGRTLVPGIMQEIANDG